MRRVLGVDHGTTRVGIAMSDPLRLTALPLEVTPRRSAIDRITELVAHNDVETVVVGVPNPLGGGDSESSWKAREFGAEVAARTGVEVVYVDERYTTRIAERSLLESGMRRRGRRETRDKVAAAIILQSYLDGNSEARGDVEDTGAR
ncbi:MAG: Holliday junction resolvase RuvX [Actinobacteria bacterium]|nr:Holliday junction resolvase RuvX [Actinomycetota bacterium]